MTASAAFVLVVSDLEGSRVARAHGILSAERPWSAAIEGASPDPRIRALGYAILAPNVYNLQPWLAELHGDDSIILRCDLARRLPQSDASDRETVITFGAFLELLSMAAAKDGYAIKVSPFPRASRAQALITGRSLRSTSRAATRRLIHCSHRSSTEGPASGLSIYRSWSAMLFSPELRSAVSGESLRVQTSSDRTLVKAVSEMAVRAYAIEKATARINDETVRITRIGHDEIEAVPDGISLSGPEVADQVAVGALSRSLLTDPNSAATKASVDHYRTLSATAAAYVWLSSIGERRQTELDVGRDWLRIHLKATELGLSFEPQSPSLNKYPEMMQAFQAMHDLLRPGEGRRVHMLSRLGYVAMMPPAPRWPVKSRVMWGRA